MCRITKIKEWRMIEYIENHDYKKTRRKRLNISSYNDMMNA